MRTAYLILAPEQAELLAERPEGWASIGPGVEITPNIARLTELADGTALVCALFNPPLPSEVATALRSWPEWAGETREEVVDLLPELEGSVTVEGESGPVEVLKFHGMRWI